MSCGVALRFSLDLVLLWLWHKPAAAAPIPSLAWECPRAAGVALENKTKQNKGKAYFDFMMGVGRLIRN